MDTDHEAREQRVEAVERALAILETLGGETPRLALKDVAARTGFYPSTILRLAASLERFGYLRRDPDGAFRLGPALARLGERYQANFDLAASVRPALARLAEATGETAAFYIREGGRRVCLFRHASPQRIGHNIEEGAVLPLSAGAGGRVLVAYTEESPEYVGLRARGYYHSQGERDPEIAAVAAPVLGLSRRFIGAIGVSGPVGRFGPERLEAIVLAVRDVATRLSEALDGRPGA